MKLGLRELTFFLLLAAIPAAAGYLVFWPHWKWMQQTTQNIIDKGNKLAQLDRVGETNDKLTGELNELSRALEFFESKLPAEQQIHTVLREVTQITDKHHLATKSVRTLKQVDSSDYIAQPIEMEMSGSFEGVYQFLLDLERLPRITRINQVKLVKDKAAEGMVQGKMVVSVYFEPSGKTAELDKPGPPAMRQASSRRGGVR